MTAPTMPEGFKPVASGYSYGAPNGLVMPEIGGATPRVGRLWARGWIPVPLTFVHNAEKHSIFELWFRHVIKEGGLYFWCYADTGFTMRRHLCLMVPGTFQAARSGASQVWSVSFTVMLEPGAYEVETDDADAILEAWAEGLTGDVMAALARLANVTSLGLQGAFE